MTEISIKKRRGTIRFVPKKWRPEYDRIVIYSVYGKSNVWIAEQLGFTKEYISMILNTPAGLELTEKLRVKLTQKLETDVIEDLTYVAQKTGSLLRKMVDNEELFAKNPFMVIDRGMDVLKGLGHLKHGNLAPPQPANQTSIGQVLVLNQAQKSDIMEGLSKIAEIKQLAAVNE